MAIHVDVIPILKDRDVQREADKLGNDLDAAGQRAGTRFGDGFASGIQRASPKIQKSFNAVENATVRANQALRDYEQTLGRTGAESEATIRASERLGIARRNEADAHRNAAAVLRQHTQAARESDSAMENINDSLQRLGTQAFRTSRGIATIAGPAIIASLWQTGRVAVTASQSLAALPAVATAAAAGIGTLQIATMGFNQAMSDIGDLDKFNADLVQLGPNAAAAALEIRNNFIPVFDQIQRAAEDKLFVGVAQRLEQLKTAFAPGIQSLTTSIAQSFNEMALGASGTLLSPTNMASIDATMNNIAGAFRNAAPAAGMFTQALTDIINVGSQFLPELGTSITDVAANFSAFIARVSASGELHDFIAQGIEATKALGDAIIDVGEFAYNTFGGIGQGEIQAWSNQVKDALTTIGILVWPINEAFKAMNTNILNTGASISDLVNPLTTVVNAIRDLTTNADDAKQNATDKLNEARARVGKPAVDVNGNIIPGQKPVPAAPGYAGSHLGYDPYRTTAQGLPVVGGNIGTGSGTGKLPKPPKPSDRERLDAIRAGLDPSLYHVDPFGQVPGLPGVPLPANAGLPGSYMPPSYPGGPGVDPQDALEARQNVERQAHDLEEARKDRLALERDNQSTAEQIGDAKEKELRAGQDLQRAQADLSKKLTLTAQDIKKGTTELSAGLDPDLGLGKGLSGLADNLVRFVGKLAFAGTERGLQDTVDATEAATGIKGGYGILGMRGANNLAAGLSPLLGNPLPAGTTQSGSTGTSPSFINGAMSSVAVGSTGGAVGAPRPGESARDFAHRVMMPYFQSQGLTVGDHAADSHGEHQNGALDIMVPDIATGQQVLQQVLSDPNVKGAIFNNQTYGYGHGLTPKPYGSTGGPTDRHEDHVHAWYDPGGTGNITPMPGGAMAAGAAPSGLGSGSGVVPVFVTNFGGGMGAGGAAAALPGGAPSGASTAGIGVGGGLNFDALSIPEAGGNWANKSNPKYRGGLQFDIPTWNQFKPPGAPADPADAAKEMQIAAAQNALNSGRAPQSLWPQNYAQLNAPLAPGGGQGPILNQYQPGVGAGLGLNPAGTAPFPPLSPDAGSPAPGDIGGIPVPASVVPGVGHGLGLTPNGLGGGPIPGSPGAPLPLGGVGPDTTRIGGLAAAESINPGGAGFGIMPGGTIDSLIQGGLQAAGSAGGMFGGGAGGAAAAAAAQTLMKLANRAIQFGGQAVGIGVQGAMDTFLPTGGSELAQNNWLTRIAGAVGAAAPALPNLAVGALGQQQQQGPLTPEQVAANGNQHGMGASPGPGNINITQNNEHTGPLPAEQSANAIADNVRTAAAAPVGGMGGPPR